MIRKHVFGLLTSVALIAGFGSAAQADDDTLNQLMAAIDQGVVIGTQTAALTAIGTSVTEEVNIDASAINALGIIDISALTEFDCDCSDDITNNVGADITQATVSTGQAAALVMTGLAQLDVNLDGSAINVGGLTSIGSDIKNASGL